MVLWRAAESPNWSKRVSLRRKGRRQSKFLKLGECLCALGRLTAEGQVLRLPQYRVVGFFRKGCVVECQAQDSKEASRFPRLLRECFQSVCKAQTPTEAWRFLKECLCETLKAQAREALKAQALEAPQVRAPPVAQARCCSCGVSCACLAWSVECACVPWLLEQHVACVPWAVEQRVHGNDGYDAEPCVELVHGERGCVGCVRAA